MILVLFRIHAIAAGLVFLALAVNAAFSRDRRALFWIAAASAYGCAVALTFAHFAGVMSGAVILATSVVAHTVLQRAASVASSSPRTSLRQRTRRNHSGSRTGSSVRTASRRAAKARSVRADRFSNTG